ncbi:MSMEG_4193 family putative phosphomutase [Arthrobacter sp. JUb115]|uniref:MSMEG_4193 family putative phosphomutase n=1 Tax=Micrococcaceae TaxID=1268 RepID=UPI000F9A9CFF|nr:MSMEG_4193 family putative phosphomutase [Arthrobacter sp. JUb115]TDU27884.1 putative phosphomutase (TIGR03848 family) [Arthrobacter sp. JUb115]
MATVILVRHGRTTANATGVLAGRTPSVFLDQTGEEQAIRTAERLAALPLAGVVSSPLERCVQTAEFAMQRQSPAAHLLIEPELSECDYGQWQGRTLQDLAAEDLWKAVQSAPSSVTFPDGESMAGMQSRAVAAIRRHDAAIEAEHGAGAVWAAFSHGDIIKSILADALGMHLDLFQRLNVGPASASIVHYGTGAPRVYSINTDAGDLSWLAPGIKTTDAPVGGGAGH